MEEEEELKKKEKQDMKKRSSKRKRKKKKKNRIGEKETVNVGVSRVIDGNISGKTNYV